MNPLVAVRALAYLALPVALAFASLQRRRERAARDDSASDDEDWDLPAEQGPTALSRTDRRAVREYLERGGNPRRLNLRYARLERVQLPERDLERVDLSHAALRGARLGGAQMSGCRLDYADLSNADLRDADLSGASLVETNLWHCDLHGALLSGCGTVIVANLRGAAYDQYTRWPPGFDPRGAGAVLTRN